MSWTSDLDRLLAQLRVTQDATLDEVAPLSAARARFLSSAALGKSRLRSRVWLAVAAALAVAASAGLAAPRLLRRPALVASLGQAAVDRDAWIASQRERLPIDFSDGSRVTLEPESRARLVELGADGAVMAVESGEISVHVVPRQENNWRFKAGPYTVRVTGTRFSVRFNPEQDLLRVDLKQGSVVVSGCALGEARPVRAGESLSASCRDNRFEIARGTASKPAAAAAVLAAPAPVAGEPVAAPGARALPRPESHAPSEDWEALARAGAYKKALAKLTALGFDAECEKLDAGRLSLLADVARFGGSSEQALAALSALRRRFAGSPAASAAAFSIARIQFDQRGSYAEAARWLRTYLKEQPRGAFAREAQGRLMEALVRLGERTEARELARVYLAQNPNGPYARVARSLTEH